MIEDALQTIPPTVRGRDTWHELVPILSGRIGAEIGPYVVPLLITTLAARYGASVGSIGLLLSLQLGAMVCALLALSPLMRRLDRRMIALGGSAMLLAGNLLLMSSDAFAALIVSRIGAGIGEGMILAAITAVAADTASPDRTFAFLGYLVVSLTLAIFVAAPWLIENRGATETLGWMTAAAAISALATFRLPRRVGAPRYQAKPRSEAIWTRTNVPFFAGYLMFQAGINMSWYFAEPIGRDIGLSLGEIGQVLILVSVTAFAGPLLAHRMDLQRHRLRALGVAMTIGAVATWVTTSGLSVAAYLVGLALTSAVVMFVSPCLLGFAATRDPSGGLATTALGVAGIGSALAPALAGGMLLLGRSYYEIGVLGTLVLAASALLILPQIARHRQADS